MTTQSRYTITVVKALRQSYGWSQKELAERSEVPFNAIANMHAGRKVNVSVDDLCLLAEAFGVTPSCLLGEPTPGDLEHLGKRTVEAVRAQVPHW